MDLGAGTVFLGGLLTFASPCVLPLIPIYLSVLLGGSVEDAQDVKSRFKLFLNGVMFVAGFLVVFILLGLTASALGRSLVKHRLLIQQLGGLLVFFFGLKFLGLVKLDLMEREKRFNFGMGKSSMNPFVAFAIGLTFAFGWTPCVGPILGSILTFTAVNTTSMLEGSWYLFLYGMGVGLPLLLVALFAQQGVSVLRKLNRFIPKIEKGTGVVLILMAVLMVTDSLDFLMFDASSQSNSQISSSMKSKGDSTMGHGTTTVSQLLSEGRTSETSPASQEGGGQCSAETACGIEGEGEVFEPGAVATAPMKLKGPIALEFIQPDCPACMKMVPLIQAVDRTCSGEGLVVETLDISIPENREFAREFGVVGTPTLIFFDEEGVEVSRLVGVQSFESIHQAVAVLMGEVCADFSRFDF